MSKKKSKTTSKFPVILISLIIVTPLILIVFLAGWLFLSQRIYPNIRVSGIDVSLLTRDQAVQKVSRTVSGRGTQTLKFSLNSAFSSGIQTYDIDLVKQETAPFVETAVTKAFEYGRTKAYFPKAEVKIEFITSPQIKKQISGISLLINQEAINSTLKVYDGEITATPSQNGSILNEEEIYSIINDYLNGKAISKLNLPLKTEVPSLSFEEAVSIKQRLEEIKASPIILNVEDLKFTLDLPSVLSLIDLENSQNSLLLLNSGDKKFNIDSVTVNGQEISDNKLTLNHEKLINYFKEIAGQVDRAKQEPLFSIDPNSSPDRPKIIEFRPPVTGRQLQIEESVNILNTALITKNTKEVKLPVNIIEPKSNLTNELGIKELIGRGVSHFTGSIENRKYNIGLASSRINGVLIPPGEEFSFVNTVGDISGATGYKQAYVIRSGRTILDDGGGVCQVSTTIFRAALNSGLPITARTAHAYRVGYYEQGFPPGLDATIYSPSVDFKFKNDTGHHILVQTYVTGNTLTIDLYGTLDDRQVSISKPIVLNQTPAPPELRQDDPSLPKGSVKQVDFAAAGANVSFSRTVTRGGITYINETFKSNFRPWQAVFLVGTKEG